MNELAKYQGTYQVETDPTLTLESKVLHLKQLAGDVATSIDDIVPDAKVYLKASPATWERNKDYEDDAYWGLDHNHVSMKNLGMITPKTQVAADALKKAFYNDDFHLYVQSGSIVELYGKNIPSGAIIEGAQVSIHGDFAIKNSIISGYNTTIDLYHGLIEGCIIKDTHLLESDRTHNIKMHYRKHSTMKIIDSNLTNIGAVGDVEIIDSALTNNLYINNGTIKGSVLTYNYNQYVSPSDISFNNWNKATEAIRLNNTAIRDSVLTLTELDTVYEIHDDYKKDVYHVPDLAAKLDFSNIFRTYINLTGDSTISMELSTIVKTKFDLNHDATITLENSHLTHVTTGSKLFCQHTDLTNIIAQKPLKLVNSKINAKFTRPLFIDTTLVFNNFNLELTDGYMIKPTRATKINGVPEKAYNDQDIMNGDFAKNFQRLNNDYAYQIIGKTNDGIYEDIDNLFKYVGQFTAPHDLI